MWWQSMKRSAWRLQLMILLSALLASLTGLVAGERPVARAQVELSASVTAIQPAAVAAHAASSGVASQPVTLVRAADDHVEQSPAVPRLSVGTFLAFKQSWLN
jgi:hypothetical protein